ncbi:lysozyme [Candidatus Pacearchaeota archaeon]|jgi:lysozyme|nr:lysozyme [Candidatus Pacearchaeota archaeon]
MRLSKVGLALIKSFEGLRLDAYQDTGGIWTIGYGHTDNVQPTDSIDEQQAENFLLIDVAWAERAVNSGVKVSINQNQFDALVSFTFNCGAGSLKNILEDLNIGDYKKVSLRMKLYVKDAKGQKLTGLVRRRKEEADLFNKKAVEQEAEQK